METAKRVKKEIQEKGGYDSGKVRAEVIRKSDDYNLYANVFLRTAKRLVNAGSCSIRDFKNNGGWIRSATYPSVYFTYCGQAVTNNRVRCQDG